MKRPRKNLVLLIVVLALSAGCANRRQPYEALTFPEVGSTSTKGVGEELISHGGARLIPKLTLPEDVAIGEVRIPKATYAFEAENSDRIKFVGGKLEIYLYKDKKNVCIAKDKCSDTPYTITNSLGPPVKNQFQRTLLYNGKIGNRIALGYREFDGNIARPAFSNEVSYDLAESSVLGYKGARIEVIKATNTEITYKILSGFLP